MIVGRHFVVIDEPVEGAGCLWAKFVRVARPRVTLGVDLERFHDFVDARIG